MLICSVWKKCYQTVTMGKAIRHLYKNRQQNWPYPSPNTKFILPQHSVNKTTYVTTDDNSESIYDIIQNKSLSILNNKNRLETSVNIEDKKEFFPTSIKHNKSDGDISANYNVSDQVQLGLDPMQCQMNNATDMALQKIPPSRKVYMFLNL